MDLRRSKYILPNLFTLASLFFGLLAVMACFPGTDEGFKRAAVAILIAMVADALDGRVARMTRTETRFGVQLDSLADLVSFGVAPAVLAWAFSLHHLDAFGRLLGPLPHSCSWLAGRCVWRGSISWPTWMLRPRPSSWAFPFRLPR